jgi:hypothetical protein
MTRWQRYRRLVPEDRQILIRAMVLLPCTEAGLRLFGFRRWQLLMAKWHRGVGNSASTTSDKLPRARRTADIVFAASRQGFIKGNCLSQSLVLWHLLRGAGASPDLRIGVRRSAGHIEAHAWVEFQGVILNDSEDVYQRYSLFEGDVTATKIRAR